MTTLDPITIARRMYELYNDGTPESYGSDRFMTLWADDIVVEYSASPQFPAGRRIEGKAGMVKELEEVSAAWRNRHAVARQTVADSNSVALGYSWWASNAIDLPGFPAGSRIRFDGVHILRCETGLSSTTRSTWGRWSSRPTATRKASDE